MTTDLKPCPCCGSEARMHYGRSHFYARCENQDCLLSTRRFRHEEMAVEQWNRRAKMPASDRHDMFAYSQSICDYVDGIANLLRNDRNALEELREDVRQAVHTVEKYYGRRWI